MYSMIIDSIRLYFFIAARVAWYIWIALAGQLSQSGQQWRNMALYIIVGDLSFSSLCLVTHSDPIMVTAHAYLCVPT